MEALMKLRKALKKKKPSFLRQDAHKKSKLKNKWRQPKGMHSKLRRKLKGKKKQPSTGYSSPKKVRGLHKLGLKEKVVKTLKDLENIDPKTEGVVLGKVGKRKKVELLKKIIEKKLTLLNMKDPQSFITKSEEEMKKKKEEAQKKEEKKKKSKTESLKKAEEKKKKEGEETLEEKADREKEEKRKVLENKNEAY